MPALAPQLVAAAPTDVEPQLLLERAPAALRNFFRIAQAWGLRSTDERLLLGSPVKSTFYRWRKGETTGGVNPDTIERISHVFGIYAALRRIFLDTARADQWLSHPNEAPLFGGNTPLARLRRGRMVDLIEVRRFLEYAAEGGL